MKYPALFNAAVEAATGKASSYNVANVPNLGACYLASFLRRHGMSAADARAIIPELASIFNTAATGGPAINRALLSVDAPRLDTAPLPA